MGWLRGLCISWAKRTYSARYQSWYKTAKWKRLRLVQLEKQPLCAMCLQVGKHTKANVADHIEPHKGDKQKFYDKTNLQSLCKHCHDSHKARQERTGETTGCDTSGQPLDRDSTWYNR